MTTFVNVKEIKALGKYMKLGWRETEGMVGQNNGGATQSTLTSAG